MQEWEYKIVQINNRRELELNRLGEQGWELVAVDELGYYYFKRPKF